MANPSINVDVGGNTAQLRRDIDKVANTPIKVDVAPAKMSRGSSGFSDLPLGRISGDVDQIDKSLAAANARVVAFAASAGAIYALQSALSSVVGAFVNVEKKLADINILLNLSSGGIKSFGGDLFGIAANTAQSFDTVAEAATELARQGLGVEETLKRTNDALILTRLSGLSAADSVSALTAAINSFSTSSLDTGDIVNKFANVDAAFAVSSADLAEAVKRVGSAAQDAGVSFDELIAIVTTAQQVTARGGAVIGNSLKTIFTRLQRSDVQDLFGDLGLSLEDANGKVKNQIQLLQDLAKAYDSLPKDQQSMVAEKVGGVFQINILKAALGDLSKEYSIYTAALQTSLSATDEAIRKNDELNKTLSARAATLAARGQQAAVTIAEPLITPLATNVLNIGDMLSKAVNNADASSFGARIGKGLLEGIGNFIGGPGLALLTAAAAKLFSQFTGVASQAFKSILGTNQGAKEQAQLQAQVGAFLNQNSNIYKKIQQGQLSVNTVAQTYVGIINSQTQALQQQASVARQIAQILASMPKTSTTVIPGGKKFYAGFIPNFAQDPNIAAEKAGARAYGYAPGRVVKEKIYDGTGKSFIGYRNLAETRTDFINADGKKATMIRPPNGFSKDTITAYSGFIPNFALIPKLSELERQLRGKNLTAEQRAKIESQIAELKKPKITRAEEVINSGGKYGVLFSQEGGGIKTFPQPIVGKGAPKSISRQLESYGIRSGKISVSLPTASIYPPSPAGIKGAQNMFEQQIDKYLQGGFNQISDNIAQGLGGAARQSNMKVSEALPPGAKGSLFEKAVKNATFNPGPKADKNVNDDRADFDFDPFSSYPLLQKLYGKALPSQAVEAKIGMNAAGNLPSKILNREPNLAQKILNKYRPKGTKAYSGFIPNFADSLQNAINRERAAGVSNSSIYVSREKELESSKNPLGFGVFNKGDEPNKKARKAAMSAKGYATGFIPNFALEDIDIASDNAANSMNSFSAGINSIMMAAVFAFAFTNKQVQQAGVGLGQFSKDLKSGGSTFLKDLQKGFQGFSLEASGGEIKKLESNISKLTASMGKLDPNNQKAYMQQYAQAIEKASSRLERIQYQSRVEGYRQNIQDKGLGYGFLIQAISGAIAQGFGGQDTKGGSIASLLGNVAGFGGLGASIKGAPGAAIGGAVGALTSIGPVINAFNDGLRDATEAAAKAKTDLQSLQNASQSLLQASQGLDTLQKSIASGESVDFSDLEEAKEKFANAMSQMPAEFQESITDFDMKSLMASVAKTIEQAGADALAKAIAQEGEQISAFNWGMSNKEGGRNLGKGLGTFLEQSLNLDKTLDITGKLEKLGNSVGQFGTSLSQAEQKLNEIVNAPTKGMTGAVRAEQLSIAYAEYDKAIREALQNLVNGLKASGQEIPEELINVLNNPKLSGDNLKAAIEGLGPKLADQIKRLTAAAVPPIQVQRMDNVSKALYDNIEKVLFDFASNAKIMVETDKAFTIDAARIQQELQSSIEEKLSGFLDAPKSFDMSSTYEKMYEALKIDLAEFDAGAPKEAATQIVTALNEGILKYKDKIVADLESSDIQKIPEIKLDLADTAVNQLQNEIGNLKKTVPYTFDDLTQSVAEVNNMFASFNWREIQAKVGSDVLKMDPSGIIPREITNMGLFLERIGGKQGESLRILANTLEAGGMSLETAANQAIQKLGQDAARAAAGLGSRLGTLSIDASIQDLTKQIDQAIKSASLFPRADLTGFVNPFKTLNKTFDQAVQNYQKAFQQIEGQYLQGVSQAGGDPAVLSQLQQQRADAINALNEDYKNQIDQLNDQWKQAEQQSAKEAINIATASGDPVMVENAIQKYLDLVGDNIRDYADFLGESESKIRQMFANKLRLDAGLMPEGVEEAAKELDAKIKQRRKIIEDYAKAIKDAGPDLKKDLEAMRDKALEQIGELNEPISDPGEALKQTAAVIAEANTKIATEGGSMAGQLKILGEAATKAAAELGKITSPGSAGGFIPNFASISNINRTKKLETAISGKPAQYYTEPFPHVRNSSQPTFRSAMRDHGGLKNALSDSMQMQMQMRYGMQRAHGFIPNFVSRQQLEDELVQTEKKLQKATDDYNKAQRERSDICGKVQMVENPDGTRTYQTNRLQDVLATGFIPNFAENSNIVDNKMFDMLAFGFVPHFANGPYSDKPPVPQNLSKKEVQEARQKIQEMNNLAEERAKASAEERKLKDECKGVYDKTWRSVRLNDMMKIIFQGDRARYLHIKNAMGFIPNFAGSSSISPAEKMMEKSMARQHGYTAGTVQKRKIWDGKGNSFTSVVNSAEDIFDFVNSKGRKATMVVPPNGFAGGYAPAIDQVTNQDQNSGDNLSKDFNSISSVSTEVVDNFDEIKIATNDSVVSQDLMTNSLSNASLAVDALSTSANSVDFQDLSKNSFEAAQSLQDAASNASLFGANISNAVSEAISSSNINVEPQVTVQAPNVSVQPILDQNVTLSNPTVAANISVNVAGMSSIDSALGDIKTKISSALNQQGAVIAELNRQLSALSFSVARTRG